MPKRKKKKRTNLFEGVEPIDADWDALDYEGLCESIGPTRKFTTRKKKNPKVSTLQAINNFLARIKEEDSG